MTDRRLEDAIAHHKAGRLPEAEAAYRDVLDAEPTNVRALHNLGVLFLNRKDVDRAVPLLAAAFENAPEDFPAWPAYAQSLIAAERFSAAEAVLAGRGADPQGAALSLRLRQAWGMALMRDGDDGAAEVQFRHAAALAPEDADTHADLGLVLLKLRRAAEAAETLWRAVTLQPAHAGAWVNFGAALSALSDTDKAEVAYRRALAVEPGHSAAARNLAKLLIDSGRHEALQAAETEGVGYATLTRRGVAQMSLGQLDAALDTFEQAIALKPEEPEAPYRRGFIRLLRRDFAGGWPDYENRLRFDEAPSKKSASPGHRGAMELDLRRDDLAGRRVLLALEQGVGDQIMFASMLPDLMRIAAEVTAVFDDRLMALYANSFPGVKLIPAKGATASRSAYDRILAVGSLGRIFRNRLEDFPGTPYLAPRPEAVERWAARLGERTGRLRVGVSWRGGLPRTGQARRSLTLDQLRPILALPACEFVSLQYGDPRAEIAALEGGLRERIRVFDPDEIDDFEDLAAMIRNLDVVVSVQTAVVHLSGALGKDCLTMLPYLPEWRYTHQGSTMPWYGSVRLFRQAVPGAWDPVIGRVVDALADRIDA